MPTYAYKCSECGNAFDIQQAFTDDALTVCPACGGALRKVFGSVGVTFNGSGFYRTDSRAAANGGKKGAGADGAAKDAGKKGESSESGSSKKDGASSGSASTSASTSGTKTASSTT